MEQRNPSATKRGPGRKHRAGHKKASPIKSRGAPLGFEQRYASPAKRKHRANVKALGRRQEKRQRRADLLATERVVAAIERRGGEAA